MFVNTEHSMRSYAAVIARDSRINDLGCGSSILRFGRSCKLLISSSLGASSPHWTISTTGSSARRRKPAFFSTASPGFHLQSYGT